MRLVLQPDRVSAKCLVHNLTNSQSAGTDEVLGFYGASMESMLPVAQNKARKPFNPDTFEQQLFEDYGWKYTGVLDQAWPEYV